MKEKDYADLTFLSSGDLPRGGGILFITTWQFRDSLLSLFLFKSMAICVSKFLLNPEQKCNYEHTFKTRLQIFYGIKQSLPFTDQEVLLNRLQGL